MVYFGWFDLPETLFETYLVESNMSLFTLDFEAVLKLNTSALVALFFMIYFVPEALRDFSKYLSFICFSSAFSSRLRCISRSSNSSLESFFLDEPVEEELIEPLPNPLAVLSRTPMLDLDSSRTKGLSSGIIYNEF